MDRMSARDAANVIRAELAEPPPEARHFADFAEKVAAELGIEQTPINVARVMHTLHDHNIGPATSEYPKWIGEGELRTIVHDESEDAAYTAKMEADPEGARVYAATQNAYTAGGRVGTVGSPNDPQFRRKYEGMPDESGGDPVASDTGDKEKGADAAKAAPPVTPA